MVSLFLDFLFLFFWNSVRLGLVLCVCFNLIFSLLVNSMIFSVNLIVWWLFGVCCRFWLGLLLNCFCCVWMRWFFCDCILIVVFVDKMKDFCINFLLFDLLEMWGGICNGVFYYVVVIMWFLKFVFRNCISECEKYVFMFCVISWGREFVCLNLKCVNLKKD